MPCSSRIKSETTPQPVTIATMELQIGVFSRMLSR